MLDWRLDTPFMSQDRPPLAIAMTATVDGITGSTKIPPCHCPESQAASQSGSRHSTCIEELLITVLRPVDSSHAPLIESSCMTCCGWLQITPVDLYCPRWRASACLWQLAFVFGGVLVLMICHAACDHLCPCRSFLKQLLLM